MIYISLIVIALFTSQYGSAKGEKYEFTNVNYVRNYDADTITFNIKGAHPLFGKNIPIRLNGIDTPELRTKDRCEKKLSYEAKGFVESQLKTAKSINLKNASRGKYFRIVADIYYDGKNLKNELMKRKYGYEYDGGTKEKIDWCKYDKIAH